jgi:ABC-type Zn2+ transport system substrate-binding protein/surface adhesin
MKRKAAKATGNNIPRSSTCTSAVVTSKSKTSNTRQEDHADEDDNDDDDEEDHDGANEDHNDDGDDLGDDDSEDEADGEGYWSGTYSKEAPTVHKYVQVLTEASSKKYKLNHIDLLSSIVLNNTLIQLKSDAEVKDIPSRSFGIVTGDEVKHRARRLTVQFLKKECVINYVQAFLATEIVVG